MCLPNKIEKFCQNETWLDIPGFDNYQASCFGRIRSEYPDKRTGIVVERSGKMSKKGYLCVKFWHPIQHKKYCCVVHKLIALTFIGNMPVGDYTVNHIDDNKLNNKASNLEYITRRENTQLAYAHGIVPKRTGKRGSWKLCPDQIGAIRRLHIWGMSISMLAKEYNVSRTMISNIIKKLATFSE